MVGGLNGWWLVDWFWVGWLVGNGLAGWLACTDRHIDTRSLTHIICLCVCVCVYVCACVCVRACVRAALSLSLSLSREA